MKTWTRSGWIEPCGPEERESAHCLKKLGLSGVRQTTGLKKAWAAFLLRQNLIWVFVLDTNSLKLYVAFKILDQYDEKVILSNFDKNISPNVYLTEDLVWVNPRVIIVNRGAHLRGKFLRTLFTFFVFLWSTKIDRYFSTCVEYVESETSIFSSSPTSVIVVLCLRLHFGVILNEVSLFSIEIAFPTSTFLSMGHLLSILMLYFSYILQSLIFLKTYISSSKLIFLLGNLLLTFFITSSNEALSCLFQILLSIHIFIILLK